MKVQSVLRISVAGVALAALSLGSQKLRAEDNSSGGSGSSCCGSVKKPYAKDDVKGTQSPSGENGGSSTNAPTPSPAK